MATGISIAAVIRLTLAFAAIGLAAELLILYLIGFVTARPDFLPHFLLSAAGLLITSNCCGLVLGFLVSERTISKGTLYLLGECAALASLSMQALFGSSLEFFRNAQQTFAINDYLLRPTLAVIVFGFLPALLLGTLYARQIEKRLAL